jgi:hypothetical protein
MTDVTERLAARFRPLFSRGGLRDVKFFLRPDKSVPTVTDLEEEVDALARASETKLKPIASVDGHIPQVRFDTLFK